MGGTHAIQTQSDGIHTPFRWVWADEATRLAETDVTQDDVDYKTAGLQEDENIIFRATAISPSITWAQIGGTGSSGGGNTHTASDVNGDTILPAVEIQRNTTGTPAAGIGVAAAFQAETDSNTNVDAGDIGFAFSEVTEPNQQAVAFIHVYYGTNRTPVMVIKADSSITPAAIADIIANLGEGAGHLGVIADETLTATAPYSFVIGGDGTNLAEAFGAVTIGGSENQASGSQSMAHGSGARADYNNAVAHAGGKISAIGDAQDQRIPFNATTTDNTPTDVLILPIPANTSFGLILTIVGRQITGSASSAYYRISASGTTGASLTTINLTSVDPEVTVEDNASWNATVTVESSSNSLIVEVTGSTSDTVVWFGMMDLIWVTG